MEGSIKHCHSSSSSCINHHHDLDDIVGLCVKPFVNMMNLDLFKIIIQATCRVDKTYSILNFGRQQLDQTGDGHFSCVGGFHPQTEKVLVLDTARFKYPPYWVDIEQLYTSVNSIDPDSNKKRGILVVSRQRNTIFSNIQSDLNEFGTKKVGVQLSQFMSEEVQLINTLHEMSSR